MSEIVKTAKVDLTCEKSGEGCDCRVRTMRLDYYAFLKFKEETGKDLQGGVDLGSLGTMETIALVYAPLKHEDPDLTMEHVARHLNPSNAQKILLTALSLLSDGLPPALSESDEGFEGEGEEGDPLVAAAQNESN